MSPRYVYLTNSKKAGVQVCTPTTIYMDNSMTTTNSFARLLVFYNAVKRSKLNEEGLTKVGV